MENYFPSNVGVDFLTQIRMGRGGGQSEGYILHTLFERLHHLSFSKFFILLCKSSVIIPFILHSDLYILALFLACRPPHSISHSLFLSFLFSCCFSYLSEDVPGFKVKVGHDVHDVAELVIASALNT